MATRTCRGAREIVALASVIDCFAVAAATLLGKMSGLRTSASSARRVGEAAGQDIGQRIGAGEVFGPRRAWRWHKDADMKTCACLTIDLTGVRMQGPGAAAAEGRMVGVAMVYNPVPDDHRCWADPDGRAPQFQARYVAGMAGRAVLDGNHLVHGFRNGDIRAIRYRATEDPGECRRQRAAVGRLLKRLHVRGLIAKVPRSRRWNVSREGHRVLGAVVQLDHHGIPAAVATAA